jgi:hypothetical protein
MEELQLQQRQMSGKGYNGLVYWCITRRNFWTTIISSGPLTFRWTFFPPSLERSPSSTKECNSHFPVSLYEDLSVNTIYYKFGQIWICLTRRDPTL